MPTVSSWVHKGAFLVIDGQQHAIVNPFQESGAANTLANSFRSSVIYDVMSKLSKRNHMETIAGLFMRTYFENVVYNFDRRENGLQFY